MGGYDGAYNPHDQRAMIEKPAEIITAYLTDSQNKEIVIDHEGKDYNTLNYYTGNYTNSLVGWTTTVTEGSTALWIPSVYAPLDYSQNFAPYTHSPVVDDWNYVFFYIDFKLNTVPAGVTFYDNYYYFTVRFFYDESDPSRYIYVSHGLPTSSTDIYSRNTYYTWVNRTDSNIDKVLNAWKVEWTIVFLTGSTVHEGDVITWSVGAPRVFYSSDFYFNSSWSPAPNFETLDKLDLEYTIDNNELFLENFTLTESLCSQDNIKFGLCEAAHCEFNCVTTDNPKVGDKIRITSKLPGSSALSSNELININWTRYNPVGGFTYTYSNYDPYFVLPICPNNIADWTNYVDSLDLRDYYFHIKFNLRITFSNVTGTEPTYFRLVQYVNYNGTVEEFIPSAYELVSECFINFKSKQYRGLVSESGKTLYGYQNMALQFYDANKTPYTFGDTRCNYMVEVQDLQFCIGSYNATVPTFNRSNLMVINGTLDEYIYAHNNAVPLGVFYIDSVSKKYRHNIVEKNITAYDKLVTLENNAADWYTSYMFGLDMDGWTSNGFEFARQIFSSYFNYVVSIGLETKDRYIETEIAKYTSSQIYNSHLSSKYLSYQTGVFNYKIRYAEFVVSNPDPTKMYMVKCVNANNWSDEEILQRFPSSGYFQNVDALGRGLCTNGGVFVWETRDNGTTAGFCVNRDDYFMISPNCTTFTIYVAGETIGHDGGVANYYLEGLSIYEVDSAPKLVNGYLRLCYYNYGTKEIFACNSSITGRDVVRSLLEVCGCFFRLDRFNGYPEFVYPTKGGLYPSNTLFPADDLYPRSGTDGVYPMGRYMSVIAENYQVKDFGRIQILKDSKTNDTVSVCEWQYEGDPDSENTYIIDDNIFYCADDMMYDYDNMPEVAQMLAGMWEVVSNLGYVPNITEALGSPWIECGDRLGLLTYDGGIETFVFRRTLKGIQNLKDTYESVGDEVIEAIDTFAY